MPPNRLREPRRSKLTSAGIERLRALDPGGHRVLSMYLNLDPAQMPHVRDRQMQADSLLDEADRRYGEDGQLSHTERLALREDIQVIRELLADRDELAAESARGLAIFRSAPAEIFEIVRLPEPVEPLVVVAEHPFIEPLVEQQPQGRWCALLISHRASRIFTGTRVRLLEGTDVLDDVHGRHSQGGWSQARYQRGIEKETDEHIRRTCAILFEQHQRRAFDHLLIGGPQELHRRVEHELQPDLRGLLAGFFEIDVERAGAPEVHERTAPLIEAEERRREQDALDGLEEALAPGGHGAVGVDEVLELLSDGRVQTLLVAEGFACEGSACPRCGLLSTGAGPCPRDGAARDRAEDVIETAIELALDRSGEVLVVRHERERLAAHGSIAALLRY